METIVDNLYVRYTEEGSGPTILMLHGWADTMHTFDVITRELSGYRIVRLDLPGFGASERPKETWGVEEYARFTLAFCKKLECEPDVLVGHSFGGRIIIKGVGEGLLQPEKVILIASAGIAKEKTWRNDVLRIIARFGKAATSIPPLSRARQKIRRKLYTIIGSDYFASGSMRDIFLKVISEDLLQYARKIKVPTLLIWGRDDASTSLESGEKIHAAIAGSQLKIIDDAGHFVHQERWQEVAELIKNFIPAPLAPLEASAQRV